MPSSFRPVAFRLPLSAVAALAEAMARGPFDRSRRFAPRLSFAFRLEMPGAALRLRGAPPGPA